MDFSIVVEGYERMTKTSSRTELTLILVDILKNTPTKLLPQVSYLTQGKFYPDFEGTEIGMAEKMVARAMKKLWIGLSTVEHLLRESGDLGTLQLFFQKKNHNSCFPRRNSASKKSSRLSTKLQELQDQVLASLGKQNRNFAQLSVQLGSKFLTRFVTGKLRLGVADFSVLDALSSLPEPGHRASLEKAYNLPAISEKLQDLFRLAD